MKHYVVALDSSGETIGTVFETDNLDKALDDSGERNHQMNGKPVWTQFVDGSWKRVTGGFEVVSE